MNIYKISLLVVFGIIIAYLSFCMALILLTWPLNSFTIEKAGTFGDSFGVINSLFTGLAFAGVIITILLQKEELGLQRIEMTLNREQFTKSALSEERNARLNALATLLKEYEFQIAFISQEMMKTKSYSSQNQLNCLYEKKREIVIFIEKILSESGIQID